MQMAQFVQSVARSGVSVPVHILSTDLFSAGLREPRGLARIGRIIVQRFPAAFFPDGEGDAPHGKKRNACKNPFHRLLGAQSDASFQGGELTC